MLMLEKVTQDFLTLKQAHHYLKFGGSEEQGVQSLRTAIKEGKLKAYKHPGKLMYLVKCEDLDRYREKWLTPELV